MAGNGKIAREIADLQDKIERLRGQREQFAQRHVEAVASRREFLDRGTPDLKGLDSISVRISTLEQNLSAADQMLESASAALVNAKARAEEERGAREREQRARAKRRVFCRPCVDWTERRPHIGGAVGAALANRCFELKWIDRMRDSRALTITPAGHRGLMETFALSI